MTFEEFRKIYPSLNHSGYMFYTDINDITVIKLRVREFIHYHNKCRADQRWGPIEKMFRCEKEAYEFSFNRIVGAVKSGKYRELSESLLSGNSEGIMTIIAMLKYGRKERKEREI